MVCGVRGQPASKRLNPKWLSLRRVVQSCIFGIAPIFCFMASASAAETVHLSYQNIRASVPLADVENFAAEGETSEALQAFLDQTPLSPVLMGTLLDAAIPDTGIPLGPDDIQFLLFQLNKVVGNPSNRGDLEPLAQALYSAYLDGNMSVLELVKRYPASEVRLDLRRLERVERDVSLFVERITPLFNFFEELLPDLVCECETESPPVALEPRHNPLTCGATDDWRVAFKQAETISPLKDWAYGTMALAEEAANTQRLSIPRYARSRTAEQVVFAFGPFRRSFSIADLTTFAETGNMPRGWRFYLKLAKAQPEDLRTVLTSEIAVKLKTLDKHLNSLPGEYALFQLGQIIHTPSRRANIQAMRSALILAAADDDQVTLLEVLQNYPTPQLIVEAPKLLRLGQSLWARGAVSTATRSLEDWLVEIQIAIADEICECDQSDPSETES